MLTAAAECLVAFGTVTLALMGAYAVVCWWNGERDEWRWGALSQSIGDRLAHERPRERWTADEVSRVREKR